MSKFFVTAIAITALVAGSTQAALIGSATQIGGAGGSVPLFGSPDTGLNSTNFVSYVLGVAGNAGETITALDVTIGGQLHQRWADADEDGTFEPSASGNVAAQIPNPRGDSFVGIPAGAAVAVAANENNPATGSPLTSTATRSYGVGNTLGFAAGFDPLPSVNFAYIVIPAGSGVNLDIKVDVATRDASGAPGPTFNLVARDFFVPEPASLALCGLAAVGLAARRRRA